MVTSDISIFNNTLRVLSKHSPAREFTHAWHLGGFVCIFQAHTQLGLVVCVFAGATSKKKQHGGRRCQRRRKELRLNLSFLFGAWFSALFVKQSAPQARCIFLPSRGWIVSVFHLDNTTQLLFCRALEHDLLCIFKEQRSDERKS